MTRQELQRSIERSAGGSLVSVAELVRWSGRSREYINSITRDIDYIQTRKDRLYFSGDVAAALTAMTQRR